MLDETISVPFALSETKPPKPSRDNRWEPGRWEPYGLDGYSWMGGSQRISQGTALTDDVANFMYHSWLGKNFEKETRLLHHYFTDADLSIIYESG